MVHVFSDPIDQNINNYLLTWEIFCINDNSKTSNMATSSKEEANKFPSIHFFPPTRKIAKRGINNHSDDQNLKTKWTMASKTWKQCKAKKRDPPKTMTTKDDDHPRPKNQKQKKLYSISPCRGHNIHIFIVHLIVEIPIHITSHLTRSLFLLLLPLCSCAFA